MHGAKIAGCKITVEEARPREIDALNPKRPPII